MDRKASSEFQFRSSKGIDPWTQWQLMLQHDTTLSLSSSNTNLQMAVAGNRLYVIDGQVLKFSTGNLTVWNTVTGTPAVTASSICSDGFNVYVAYGASGIYSTNTGISSASQYVTSTVSSTGLVRYTMGRLMVAVGTAIYNVVGSGALPSALFTSNYSGFVWTDFTDGNGVIFCCGNSGDKSVIYSIQINTDGSALAAPIICGQLPNGESVQAIYGYAGSGVAVGTSLGWRFAEQALANGVAGTVSLTIGPLTPIPSPVIAFSGYSRFIWFTYQNYDTGSTGLGRMDPSVFVSDLAPAFASDLMATTQGQVNSIVHFGGMPVFSVSGIGVYKQASTFVPSGTIDSGLITYGLADNKLPVFVDLTTSSLVGSITTSVSLNAGPFTGIGTFSTSGATFAELSTPQNLSETIEIREQLNAGSTNTVSPTLTRHTLRSVPAPKVPTDINVVIQLREVCRIEDVEFPLVPSQEYKYLDALRETKQISTLQVGNMGPYTITIEFIDHIPEQVAALSGELNAVCVLTCRTVV